MTELARRTLEGDEPTLETLGRSPLGWLQYVERDGVYYEIHQEVVSSGTVSGPEYELSRSRDGHSEPDGEPLRFEALPLVDQWRLNEAADFSIDHLANMSFSIAVVAGYLSDAAHEESVLVDGIEQSTLSVDGTLAVLEQGDETTANAERIQFSTTRVADDSETFAAYIRAENGAELPPVSKDVEWLLATVRDDENHRISICRTDLDEENADRTERQRAAVDELRAVHDDLEADPSTPDDISYVRYEGQWYRLSIGESVV